MSDDVPTKGPHQRECSFSGLSVAQCQDSICDCFTDGQDDGTSGIRPDAFEVVGMESIAQQLGTVDLESASFAMVVVEGRDGPEMNMFSLLHLETVTRVLEDALASVRNAIERGEAGAGDQFPF